MRIGSKVGMKIWNHTYTNAFNFNAVTEGNYLQIQKNKSSVRVKLTKYILTELCR